MKVFGRRGSSGASKRKLSDIKDAIITSFRLLKLIWGIDPWLVSISMVAILTPAVIPFLNMYIYKLVIDLVVKIVSGQAVFDPNHFYPLIFFRLLTFFIQDSAFRTQSLAQRLLWTKVPIHLNQIVFRKISELDIYYFENDKFRDLLEKVREAAGYRPQRLIEALLFGFQSLLQLTIAFVTLTHLNWVFALVISFMAIPEFIDQAYRSKLAYGIWDAEGPLRKRFGYLSHLIQHHKEVKEVKMFRLADKFLTEVKNIQQKFYDDNRDLAIKRYVSGLIFNGFGTLVFVGIEIFVIFQALAKKVTVGDIAFYTGVVSNFQNGLGGLLRNINEVFDSSLYVKSIF